MPKHSNRHLGIFGPPLTRRLLTQPAKPPSQLHLLLQQLRHRRRLSIQDAQPFDLLTGIDGLAGDFVGYKPADRVTGQGERTLWLTVTNRRKSFPRMLFDGHGSIEPSAWLLGNERMDRLRCTPLRREVSQAH